MLLRLPPPTPPRAAPDRWRVRVVGRIANREILHNELDARDRAPASDSAEDVVAGLLTELAPAALAPRLLGDWLVVAEDRVEGVRWVLRDPTGIAEIAWATIGADLLVGPPGEVASAIGAAADREAVGIWLATGALPAPLTGWREVHALPAGHVLRLADGAPEVRAWWTLPASTPGTGSPGDGRRWAKGIRGAFQVAVMHRLEGVDGVVVHGPDLDEAVAAMADSKRRTPWPRFEAGRDPLDAATLESLCVDGPALPRWAVSRFRAFEAARATGARLLLSGDGGRAILGADRHVAAHRVVGHAGLLARMRGIPRDAVERHLGWRGVVSERVLPADPDPRATWTRPFGPSTWGAALEGPDETVAHALDRAWWLRARVLPAVGRAARVAGVEVRLPWADPAVEALCAQVPTGLLAPIGRPGAVARAVVPEADVRRPAPPADAAGPDVETVAETLSDWVDGNVVRATWSDPTVPDVLRWRLGTVACWRRASGAG